MKIKHLAALFTLLTISTGQIFAADPPAAGTDTNNLLRGYYNNGTNRAGVRMQDPAGADRRVVIDEPSGADRTFQRATNDLRRGYDSTTNSLRRAGDRINEAAGADRNLQPNGMERITRAKDLIGMDVKNAQGESLGKIEDVALNVASGRIAYVALSSGGFFGIRDRLYAIPLNAFAPSSADDKVLVLNIDKETLKNTPGFVKTHWPEQPDQILIDKAHGDIKDPAGADLKARPIHRN